MNIGGVDIVELLTTYEGRINRAKYWIAALVFVIAWIIAAILFFVIPIVGAILGALIALASIVCGVFVGIKRLHDRDKSGWWLLLFYLGPTILDGIGRSIGGVGFAFSLGGLAISIWAFVELGCLRGTAGPNQYGADPLAGVALA